MGVDTAVFTAYRAGVAGLSGVDNGLVVLAKGKGLADLEWQRQENHLLAAQSL